ncbi:MAG TPA: ferritin [Methanothermobacter sp.]|jgi:bacterioferritin|uniref:Ferritin n=1 Tax=Methanothermobacter tenebrarum TaxID=680118 RepID=A0ABN6PF54_9EURY|nr:demethoxyubiquinone hydroxylase family protein [Methanothermobacter tenebrarum]MDD3454553.1 demethoxyubiquinone hydroxylase family protein [Methanobacteriales archaeon]MDI6881562.1 demethoxyubiquinone hydroxylase family protein [Methanothermobacter sp.]MDX9693025.1 demethoxyubiquinone hydroxylase family protein [Methanothermobacter sp.]BDH79840.1 ferritin [Methanothermobacter tenebrarum]HHW16742.1 ferritin [Methanothermobacter sp.]
MDNREIIKLLNIDFKGELEATMLYTYNAFVMDDCEISRLTEGVAADEMRHMWWLADLITKRGGRPSMEIGKIEYMEEDIKDALRVQIQKETEGIEEYEEHIRLIDDEEVVGVLRHIIDEEKRHRREFKEKLEKLK